MSTRTDLEHSLIRAAVLLLTLTGPATSQLLHLTFTGEKEFFGLGRSLGAMPDMNQDGTPDLVVGANSGIVHRGGYVAVYSGADGSVLLGPNTAEFNYDLGGSAASAGDFDGDGVTDYMAGSTLSPDPPYHGEVRVYSGTDGHKVVTLKHLPGLGTGFGSRIYPLGDLNQDGFDDVAVVSHSESYVGIYGGPDGSLLRRHDCFTTNNWSHVAKLGDLDADGVSDYAVGDPDFPGLSVGRGRVRIFSGATSQILNRTAGEHHDNYGVVAPLGDVDLDGIPDWAVGVPEAPLGACGVQENYGYLDYRSGLDGRVIRRIFAPTEIEESFGGAVAGGGDVNGDGVWDLLVAGTCYHANVFRVFSGRTGAQLWSVREEETPGNQSTPPVPLAILGDLNQDGFAEFAVADFRNDMNGTHAGAVFIFQGGPGEAEPVCVTSPNSAGDGAILRTQHSVSVSDAELVLTVDGAPKGEQGQFVYGPDLVNLPHGDGVLCVGGGALGVVPLAAVTQIDDQGHAKLAIDFDQPPIDDGPGAWLPGTTWTVQFVYRDPGGPGGTGINTSDALRLTLNP